MKSLPLHQLYKACVLKDLPFKTTKQLEPLAEIVGQNRAQEAVRFALAMPHGGYNVYAVGRNGLGKRTMMLRYLEHHVDTDQQSHDWCYVANFEEPRIPKLLQLPAGKGTQLKQDMEKLMSRLVKVIPQTFDSDSFLERSEQLKNEYGKKQEDELEKVAAFHKSPMWATLSEAYRQLHPEDADEGLTFETFKRVVGSKGSLSVGNQDLRWSIRLNLPYPDCAKDFGSRPVGNKNGNCPSDAFINDVHNDIRSNE